MLKFKPCPNFEELVGKRSLGDWGLSKETTRLLQADPNAFFLGGVFDRQVTAEQAWEIPLLLSERLGHLDVRKISRMSEDRLASIIRGRGDQVSLHRFPNVISRSVIISCQRLVSEYGADASNIWKRDPGARLVLERLQEFHGIKQKIASMMARLLIEYYGVRLSRWDQVDVAVDRHVARVFVRTGLVAGSRETSLPDIRDDVISAARNLVPSYPAALDEPSFVIGKYWCTAKKAYCRDGEEPCPLAEACTKRRRSWQIG
jgi:uncharacterized HhH-GPD family protein